MSTIYLDHNATTRPLPAAVQAMSECPLELLPAIVAAFPGSLATAA